MTWNSLLLICEVIDLKHAPENGEHGLLCYLEIIHIMFMFQQRSHVRIRNILFTTMGDWRDWMYEYSAASI